MSAKKRINLIRTDKVISSAAFPLRENEVLDLLASYLDLKTEFKNDEVIYNDKFFLVCLKLEGATVNISYKGKLKFFSTLSDLELRRLYCDLWADIFKKNVKKAST